MFETYSHKEYCYMGLKTNLTPSMCSLHRHGHPINGLCLKLHDLKRSISEHGIQVRPPKSLLCRLQPAALEVEVSHRKQKGHLHLLHCYRLSQTSPLSALKWPPCVPRHLIASETIRVKFCGIGIELRIIVHGVLHASDQLASSGELLAFVGYEACAIFPAG